MGPAARERAAHARRCATSSQLPPRSSPRRSTRRASTSMRSRNSGARDRRRHLIKRKFLTWGVNTTLDSSRSCGSGRLSQHRRSALPLHLRAAEHRQPRQRHGVRLRHLGQHQHGQGQDGRRSATSGTAKASASIARSTWPGAARTSPCARAAPIGSTAPGSTTTGRCTHFDWNVSHDSRPG